MILIILIIFVPFSAFLYPDFKEIQVIEEEEKDSLYKSKLMMSHI